MTYFNVLLDISVSKIKLEKDYVMITGSVIKYFESPKINANYCIGYDSWAE